MMPPCKQRRWDVMMHQNKQDRGKRKTAIAFQNWKYKHNFELISSTSENIVVCCLICAEKKKFSTVTLFFVSYSEWIIYEMNKSKK